MTISFNLDTYIEQLSNLVNIDCGSHNPQGVAKVADVLAPMFESIGFHVVRHNIHHDAGPCLEITNKPNAEHYDVMLCGHMDTVFPDGTVAKRPLTRDDEKIYGPGVTDMKSGILSAWYALQMLPQAQKEKLSIVIALNCDEEIGSRYSREWVETLARKSSKVLVCEASRANGNLIRSRKGNAKYELTFNGVASHAGSALQDGVSAIYEFSHWALAIKNLVNLETGTTMNVGTVKGGVAVNVVPDYTQAIVDLRFWNNEEAQVIHNTLLNMAENPFEAGASVEVKRLAFKPAMIPTDETEALITMVSAEADKLDLVYDWENAGGGSDGNFTANVGTPTLDGFGPSGAGLHSDKEYLLINTIEPRLVLLVNVLNQL
ncbi:peptidase M20 [Vibrio sp. UCD-FRSSP16_10]|uniref:M20 family metallopeptidase n=1 Tax=unclassified Vibrio TaxID=2614977 RepID=UPI0007FFCA5C|nr:MULTISPECIES: M20 family metallopeptidase [unclassified Vibrio]OBT08498.1 peptidase M20 [Vibrio sp. UCD-FRSSP16_30]OBT18028.1 peptidase M20 [Vibrio sp. UCD-FRSSP16_10]